MSIDGTVLGIARTGGNIAQISAYNGHKRKHALKYQAVNTFDGMVVYLYGSLERQRHEKTLYIRSSLKAVLPNVLDVNSRRYCLYDDTVFNRGWFMEVMHQGSKLPLIQTAPNKAMSAVRITFK